MYNIINLFSKDIKKVNINIDEKVYVSTFKCGHK
jgi:hypothetical protein